MTDRRAVDAETINEALENGPRPHDPVLRLYGENILAIESDLVEADDDLTAQWDWDSFTNWVNDQEITDTDLGALSLDMAENN